MKPMKIESQEDAIDLGYRIRGLAVAIQKLFDPVNIGGERTDKDIEFAAQMIAESMGDYVSVLLSAVDYPSPQLIFTPEGDADGRDGG